LYQQLYLFVCMINILLISKYTIKGDKDISNTHHQQLTSNSDCCLFTIVVSLVDKLLQFIFIPSILYPRDILYSLHYSWIFYDFHISTLLIQTLINYPRNPFEILFIYIWDTQHPSKHQFDICNNDEHKLYNFKTWEIF